MENCTKETFSAIISDEEILEEGFYRKELAEYKWNAYLNDVEEIESHPSKINKISILKPYNPHLALIKRIKYIN